MATLVCWSRGKLWQQHGNFLENLRVLFVPRLPITQRERHVVPANSNNHCSQHICVILMMNNDSHSLGRVKIMGARTGHMGGTSRVQASQRHRAQGHSDRTLHWHKSTWHKGPVTRICNDTKAQSTRAQVFRPKTSTVAAIRYLGCTHFFLSTTAQINC